MRSHHRRRNNEADMIRDMIASTRLSRLRDISYHVFSSPSRIHCHHSVPKRDLHTLLHVATEVPSSSSSSSSESTEESELSEQAVASTSGNDHSASTHPLHKLALLWDDGHVAAWSPLLALYLPFGAVLAALRMLLWCGGVLLDLPMFKGRGVVSAWLAMLGVRVTWKHLERLPAGKHVLVSNHRC